MRPDEHGAGAGDLGGRSGPECPFSARLSAYYDGELAPSERRQVEGHIGMCPLCAQELKQLRGLSRLLGDAPPVLLPEGFLGRMHRAVGPARRQVLVRIAWPALAAAALLLIGFSVLLWQTSGASWPGERADIPWQIAVTSVHAQASAEAGPEELLTDLIVADLSREGSHE